MHRCVGYIYACIFLTSKQIITNTCSMYDWYCTLGIKLFLYVRHSGNTCVITLDMCGSSGLILM